MTRGNHHAGRIVGNLYQKLQPWSSNLATVEYVTTAREQTRNNSLGQHSTRIPPISTHQDPIVLVELSDTGSDSIRKLGGKNRSCDSPDPVGSKQSRSFHRNIHER